MEPILSKTYYGNTVEEWLLALLAVFVSLVAGRLCYWVFSRVVRRYTARTRTRLDDLIIDMVEEPVVFAIVLAGLWYGSHLLTLPDSVRSRLGGAFEFLLALIAGWLLVRLFESVHREYLVPWARRTETDLDDQLLPIIGRASKSLIWVMAVIIGLDNAGYDVGALLAGLGIGGLALAMAARDTVANVFGGFTIFVDKPFTLNDRVRVAGYDGFIREVGLRSTRLETLSGTVVTIPNAKFADSTVENVSREPSRKVSVSLGLTYDTSPEQMDEALEILRRIARANDHLEEKALVWFSGFGDSSMNIQFIYYIRKGSDIASTQGEVNRAILRHFNRAGLEFAFPTRTLYTKRLD